MASLQARLSALISAIGADVKAINQSSTITSSSAPTPIGSAVDNYFSVTAYAALAGTFQAPSGTPVDGNHLLISIKDAGTARNLAWNAIYRAINPTLAPLPTTTVAGKWMDLVFMYNATDVKWDLLSVFNQA